MLVAPLLHGLIGNADTDWVIAEWTQEGSDGTKLLVAPLHLHRACDEAWYVLEGALAFQIGDEEVHAPAGSAVMVPKGTPHTYWNPLPQPARYLLVMTSLTFRLIEAIHALEDRSPERLRALFEGHDAELLG
jgi:mannose-6-phosphate isomerase-like protein (cupin superfamily)